MTSTVYASLALLLLLAPGAGKTARVSVDSQGTQANGACFSPVVSANGRVVAFASAATNLAPFDSNGADDIFVHDFAKGTTARVSVASNGAPGNGDSTQPALSADGRVVAFASFASNLVPGDTNGQQDVFVHDRKTGVTTRVSVNSVGSEADGSSHFPAISANGRFVAFASFATDLVAGDSNGLRDVFVHDRKSGETTRVSVGSGGVQGDGACYAIALSGDGLVVAFMSYATNLVPGDTNGVPDVFVHDRKSGETTRVSVDSEGGQANGISDAPSLSANGRTVAFDSDASDLVAGDSNGRKDIFVHDRKTGVTTRVSVDSQGGPSNDHSFRPFLSPNGRKVAFCSHADDLVAGDFNANQDVFVRDLKSGKTALVSVDSFGGQANSWSDSPSLSRGARRIAFRSSSTNLVSGDTNGFTDILVHDRKK